MRVPAWSGTVPIFRSSCPSPSGSGIGMDPRCTIWMSSLPVRTAVSQTRLGPALTLRLNTMSSLPNAGAVSLVATGRFEEVDLTPLARDRFEDPARWVTEDLHI